MNPFPSHDPRAAGALIRMQIPNLTLLEARVLDSMTGRTDFSDTTAYDDAHMMLMSASVLGIAQQDAKFYESNLSKTMNAVGSKRTR